MSAEFAKTHLREHLVGLLVGPVAEGFWSIYDSAKELCDRNNQPDQILRTFQNMLTRIPDWNETTLQTEEERIVKQTKCTYMDDLLMGVFISYMNLSKFIHELYKQSARKFWQVAYFFKTVGVTAEQQARNRQDIEKMIAECMEQVIRGFLPWEAIAKKYFNEDGGPESESESESEEDVEQSKGVSFGDDADSDDDDDDDKPEIHLGEEDGTIEFEDLDKPEPAQAPEPEKEVDPLAEIEGKVGEETLVLNL
jgi:hypothetical protein